MNNHKLNFLLKNDVNSGVICNSQLKEELKNWIRTHSSFSIVRIRQIWSATWEAIQNAIIHGSEPGETIEISVSYLQQNELIIVAVRQPKIWEEWEDNLGNNKKQNLDKNELLMGGTIIMLQLANDIYVFDSGRTIEMQFSSKVMPERKIALYADQSINHKPISINYK